MAEALEALIDELFSPRINLHRLQATCGPRTARSLRAAASGSASCAKGWRVDYLFIDGAWRDHVLNARLNPAFVKPPGW